MNTLLIPPEAIQFTVPAVWEQVDWGNGHVALFLEISEINITNFSETKKLKFDKENSKIFIVQGINFTYLN